MTRSPDPAADERYELGPFQLDVGAVSLERDGEAIPLQPLTFRLLTELARAAPNVVSGDTLMEALWPDVVVGEENLKQRVKLLREAMGDAARNPQFVGTVRGFGYKLLVPVERLGSSAAVDPSPDRRATIRAAGYLLAGIAAAIALGFVGYSVIRQEEPQARSVTLAPRRVLIAPFGNHTGDGAGKALTVIAADAIGTRLTETGVAEVLPSSVVLSMAGDLSADPERRTGWALEAAAESGAATVVTGGLEPQGSNSRFVGQLIDTQQRTVIDSIQPVEFDPENPEAAIEVLVDRVLAAVATHLNPSLNLTALPTSRPRNYESYRHFALGIEHHVGFRFAEAAHEFSRAFELDPGFAQAGLMEVQALRNFRKCRRGRQPDGSSAAPPGLPLTLRKASARLSRRRRFRPMG